MLRRLRDLGDAAAASSATTTGTCSPSPPACGRAIAATPSTTSSTRPTATPGSTGCAHRPMAVHAHGWLMLHAGVVPQWDLATTLQLAADLERALRDSPPREFLGAMFGNEPLRWSEVARGRRAAALHPQRHDPDPLRHRRRHARVRDQGRRRRRAAGLPRLVRRPRPPHRRHADRLRPLVGARPARPAGRARPRHRLRLGRQAERRAHRRQEGARSCRWTAARKAVLAPPCAPRARRSGTRRGRAGSG